jgi:DNA-binding PadR family transcriptional regulator
MNRKKKFAFNVQLAILGFLKERDFYGYELKKYMERFMRPWSDIKFGSIYYALERLTQDGLVEPAHEAAPGGPTERTIFRITPKGRRQFTAMLEESLAALQQTHFLLDVSLFFAQGLPREAVARLLEDRAEKTAGIVAMWEAIGREHVGNDIARLLIEHGLLHLRAEHAFLLEAAQRFAAGDPWGGKSLRDWLEGAPRHDSERQPRSDID